MSGGKIRAAGLWALARGKPRVPSPFFFFSGQQSRAQQPFGEGFSVSP